MQIQTLLFAPTGTYNDIGRRPYVPVSTRDAVVGLQEATENGKNLTSEALGRVASQILRPSPAMLDVAEIPNGWGSPRLRFLMTIVEQNKFGGEIIQYLSGYTDHSWVTNETTLDPDMRLYFNRSIQTRRLNDQQHQFDCSHILTGLVSGPAPFSGPLQTSMRPEDVFNCMSSMSIREFSPDIIDMRSTFAGSTLKKSALGNGIPAVYLHRIAEAYRMALIDTEESEGLDGVFLRAGAAVKEPLVNNDLFLREALQRSDLHKNGYITYGELCALQSDLDARTTLVKESVRDKLLGHCRGESAEWSSVSLDTDIAVVFANAIPGLMAELSLQHVSFGVSNQTVDGRWELTCSKALSLTTDDVGPAVQAFKSRLQPLILNDITRSGLLGLQVLGDFDLLGESKLAISANGGRTVPYCVPSFADGLVAPVISPELVHLDNLTGDLSAVLDNLDFSGAVQPQ